MRILVVEDNSTIGSALAAWLRREGFDVEWSPNAEAALVKLEVFKADAVILDYVLPMADGLALLKALRQREGLKSLPVVVTTGLPAADLPALAAHTGELGVVKIFQKPYEENELKGVLLSLQPPPSPAEALASVKGGDPC